MSPDFGSLVYPGDDYCGLDEFHGENQDTYIKVIPDSEPSILEDMGLPLSFYKALAAFFIGGAIRIYRGDSRNHAMLIHPSQRKYDHQIVLRKVNSVMNEWREHASTKLDGIEDISYQNLLTHLKNAYVDFKNDGVILPSFSELESYILECIRMCPDAHLCNGDEDASENSRFYRVNIFVGGNLVERGLTIKGLAVTYIIRRARGVSNVDNTEQRARWFGYKRSFLDVCRVFTTQPIKDDFSSILEHDDDLWATIERAELRGVHFKEIPRVFVLANKMLNMTRTNVARAERFTFSEWNKQDILLLNRSSVDSNIACISAFRDRHQDLIEILDYHGVNKHALIRGLDFFEVKRTLLNHLVFPQTSVLDRTFFNKLEEALIKSGINPVVDILWLRDTVHETRTISVCGKINQLFQGRNSTQGSKTYYPGDSSMVTIERSDVMQLQIHLVKPKNLPEINYYSPAIALYVPVAYSEQMERLVGQI
ncbi:Z1 domain-containing protein [Paenibacillus thiaminolyticus]|uniref:Z1 domain-containing protein n=1 Tax=Paenibacillus thiaminolyticus TaxID=49283 RepID=UPI00235035D7|nr:Z1 domain-containing protein [Paenibacillus thiaminolyticus]WCR24863.1 Z1 domain-containing protein [Paenibacillus thiaminolyticus]